MTVDTTYHDQRARTEQAIAQHSPHCERKKKIRHTAKGKNNFTAIAGKEKITLLY